MFEVAPDAVTKDALVQAVATIITALLAVVVGYIGARVGAKATREATERGVEATLRAEREARAEQERAERRDMLMALLTELTLNEELASNQQIMWFAVPFERAAFTQSLPILGSLPSGTYFTIEDAWGAIARYNTLVHAGPLAQGADKIRIANEAKTEATTAKTRFHDAAELLTEHLKTI